jgi:hypothetical protein
LESLGTNGFALAARPEIVEGFFEFRGKSNINSPLEADSEIFYIAAQSTRDNKLFAV